MNSITTGCGDCQRLKFGIKSPSFAGGFVGRVNLARNWKGVGIGASRGGNP